VAVARAHDIFDAQDVVKVSSVLLLFYGIGAVFGPILSAAVMTLSGTPYGLYFYMIAVSGVYAGVTLLLRRRESVRIVPVDEQVEFVMMETTSDVAMHLDPRMEISPENPESTVSSNGPVQDHDRAGA
jgi:hypothetical protein